MCHAIAPPLPDVDLRDVTAALQSGFDECVSDSQVLYSSLKEMRLTYENGR